MWDLGYLPSEVAFICARARSKSLTAGGGKTGWRAFARFKSEQEIMLLDLLEH
jgi:hypothetical protein